MARPTEKALASVTDVFGLLSDATRLRIVLTLVKSERNVTGLCEELQIGQPLVSHHLGLLRMSGVVVGKRKGKQVIYSLATNTKVVGGKLKISLPPYSVTVEWR